MIIHRPHEDQKSVSEWCDEHYPGMDEKARALDVIEEAMELAAVMGISREDALNRAAQSWDKSQKDFGDRTQIPGELADIQIAVMWVASLLALNAQTALDDKMGINRAKTPGQSSARRQRKDTIFNPSSSTLA